MRSNWKVYIKPFDATGTYTSYIDVTDDVDFSGFGAIAQSLDNTEYDIGVYRNSNFKLTLNNIKGKYSDIDAENSIFNYKRSESLVKVTWSQGALPECGVVVCGETILTEEITVFTGLLNDDTSEINLKDLKISFAVLGLESTFLRTIVPFGSISNGDNISTIIYTMLNRAPINTVLTVSALNITVGIDTAIDSNTELRNKTVQEGLNKLLLASNSVLYIENETVYVAPRTPSAATQFYFYGQGAENGAENIILLDKIKTGVAKIFNFFSWKDTTVSSTETDSAVKYGIRKKEVDLPFITTLSKQLAILDDLLAEFAWPKQEFDLHTPLDHDTIALSLLDKVSIDYPALFLGETLPICGEAICGEFYLPNALQSFEIDPIDEYKIIGRSIDTKKNVIRFRMRAV